MKRKGNSMTIDPNQAAKEIISNFKKYYLNDDGLVSISYPPIKRTIFDNFDDFVPFFIYFDEVDFLITQVEKIKKNYSYDTILAQHNLIYSYKIDEYIGGLYCLWEKTGNSIVKDVLDDSVQKTLKYFFYKDNFVGTYDIISKKRSKFYYYWSSGILETFLEMYEHFPFLQKIVEKVVNKWLKNEFFKKYHLFPFRWSDNPLVKFLNSNFTRINRFSLHQPPTFLNKDLYFVRTKASNLLYTYFTSGSYAHLMKANTTFVFTLIELYRQNKKEYYKDVVTKWINSVLNKLMRDDLIYGYFYPNGKVRENSLTNTFIFIDVLMDTYFFVDNNKSYLEIAKKLIDKWFSLQWDTGLIPMFPEGQFSRLDNLVDFSVSIRRYAELSGNDSYLRKSIDLMSNTLKIHKGKYGYYDHARENGKPIINRQYAISPKYNGLALKGIINLLTTQEKMYSNNELHSIFKDR